jgi:hypothetical protein
MPQEWGKNRILVLPQRSAQCNFLAKSGRIPGMLDPANTSLREDFAAI